MIALFKNGTRFKTQYDKPGDPQSLDCTMNMTILEPETDPMIHMAFPGGIEDLKEYVLELKGYKNHWVKNINDENDIDDMAFEERTMPFNDPFIRDMYDKTEPLILQKIKKFDARH